VCSGGSFDSLQQVEDLEGTGAGDVFHGGPEANQLLGHAGPDSYFAEAGNDTILANSADFDPTIDCGEGIDLAVIDLAQFGDVPAPNCETVREGAADEFQDDTELPPEVAPKPPEPTIPPSNRFKLLGLTLDHRHGTARLRVRVPGAGRLAVHGKGVRPLAREARRAATLVVTIRPNSRLARAMRLGEHRARVTVTITFRPSGGSARSARRALTLIRAA
jgi:hypothetical protein